MATVTVTSRPSEGSRATRRLRRRGFVPGVVYGAGDPPQAFEVDARTLRNTLAQAGAVIELAIDGGKPASVITKDIQRHPVRGEIIHVDFLRVRMDRPIQSTTILTLVNAENAPGVVEGGVLDQAVRELNIEALPADLPESIEFDVSGLDINTTAHLSEVTAPKGVTLLDDPETVIASVLPPTVEPVEEEIETETAVVGEEGEAAEAEAEGAEEAESSAEE